jgi:hypothetical protein
MRSSLIPILAFGVGLTAADALTSNGDTSTQVPKFVELSFDPKREGRANETTFTALEQNETQQPTTADSSS